MMSASVGESPTTASMSPEARACMARGFSSKRCTSASVFSVSQMSPVVPNCTPTLTSAVSESGPVMVVLSALVAMAWPALK